MADDQLAIVAGPEGHDPVQGLAIIDGPGEQHVSVDPHHVANYDRGDVQTFPRTLRPTDARVALGQRVSEGVSGALDTMGASAARVTKPISRRVLGMSSDAYDAAVTGLDTPDTTAGAVGKFGGQAAELLIPELLASKFVSGTRLAARAGTLAKAALSGAGTAAIIGAQGGDATQAATSGALAAASPLAGQFIATMGPGLRTSAGRAIAKGLGETDLSKPEVGKAVASAVPVALDEGIRSTWAKWIRQTGLSKDKIGQSIQHILADEQVALNAGRPVEAALGNQPVFTKDLIAGLETYKQQVAQNVLNARQTGRQVGAAAQGNVLAQGAIPYNARMVKIIDDMQQTLAAHGQVIPLRNVMRLKQDWDSVVPYIRDGSGAMSSGSKLQLRAKAAKAGADLIRGLLDDKHPEVAAIDDAYSAHARLYGLLYKAATGTEMPDLVAQGTKAIGKAAAKRLATGLGGAIATGSAAAEYGGEHRTRNIIGGTILGGITGALLQRAFDSPAWQTFPATQKLALSRAIASGDAEAVRRLVTPVLALSGAAATAPGVPTALAQGASTATQAAIARVAPTPQSPARP